MKNIVLSLAFAAAFSVNANALETGEPTTKLPEHDLMELQQEKAMDDMLMVRESIWQRVVFYLDQEGDVDMVANKVAAEIDEGLFSDEVGGSISKAKMHEMLQDILKHDLTEDDGYEYEPYMEDEMEY